MRRILALVSFVAAAHFLGGCEAPDKKIDDSRDAPPPTYHMVPSQKDPNYNSNK